MASSLSLLKFCILDKDARKAKFSFKLFGYSNIDNHRRSKPFRFAGHVWKLQITKKKDYFGMYLRWYGTDRFLVKDELSLKCATIVNFSILNNLHFDDSITEGTRNDIDIFEKLRGGIGYSRVVRLSELEKSTGYIIDDSINLQIKIKVLATTYSDRLQCAKPHDRDYVQGIHFPFYGTTWYLLFFPYGENPESEPSSSIDGKKNEKEISISNSDENEIKKKEKLKSQACIYLMRQTDVSRALLRHNVCFMISVSGGNDFALEQHFYNEDSNIFGSASFMPIPKLRKLLISNKVKVSVTYKEIVPYFYFAYSIKEKDNVKSFDNGVLFKDQYCHPWLFELDAEKSSETVIATITLDPHFNNALVKSYKEKERLLQICWFVELLSPVDIEKSLTFKSRGRRDLQEATFSAAGEQDSVVFPISIEELSEKDSPYLDEDGKLCIRLSILECNFVVDSGIKSILVESVKENESELQTECPMEEALVEDLTKLENLDEKDMLIQSLIDHIDAYENYIKDLEQNPTKALTEHEETSINLLISKCRPNVQDYESLVKLAKTIEDIIKTLPVPITDVLHAGALGQGTIVANHYQLDLIVFLEDYKQQKGRIKIILNAIQERVQEHCSKDASDLSLDRSNTGTSLPFSSHFYRTSKALIFKLAHVNVTIMLSKSISEYEGYEAIYEKASKVSHQNIYRYNILTTERQIEFIDRQSDLCKDLICVIKAWSDSIKWNNPDSRPSSYLLSLILIHAYEKIERLPISQTPSFEKEVLVEFGMIVLDEDLNIEWETFYDPVDYPLDSSNPMFIKPLIRDPANPYHNICYTGIADWSQFRDELTNWISSLVY